MRRNLFLASALVMGLMSSCSNDVENVTAPSEKLQPIELAVGSPSVVINPSTKGVGTVGDLTNQAGNVWNGENLYVIMMCKYDKGDEVWEVSKWPWIKNFEENPVVEEVSNFDNLKVQAPTGTAAGNIVLPMGEQPKYYPPTDTKHAFFAYHIDDAAANDRYESQAEPELVKDDEARTSSVYFKIDGSQDLMQGEAIPSKEDPSGLAFSAKGAREGIDPIFEMKHLLTRFTFEVKGGQKDQAGFLKVKKISVKSKYKGKMCVAYFDNPGNLITFEDESTEMSLKERAGANQPMTDLTAQTLTDEFAKIGEALMVAPGEREYEISIVTTQMVDGDGKTNTFEQTSKITIPQSGVAAAGTSYKIQITLYGLSKIPDITAKLTGWEEGDDISVSPSDDL